MTPNANRLEFRRLEASDVTSRYVDWLNDPAVNEFLETRFSVQDIASCMDYVERTNADPSSHFFGVFLKDEGRHIGNAKLGFINPWHKTGELSLLIGDKGEWGKGYGTEIVRALTAYGFEELALERIEAGCYEANLGSLQAFLRAGYTVEGFFRKSLSFGAERCGCFWLGILKHEFGE